MRTTSFLLAAALIVALPGCIGNNTAPPGPPDATPPATTTPPPPATTPTPPATTTPPPAGDASLTGTWRSASCGTRKYERDITFAADGSFTSADLVSPCPPRVACVWSGIVNRKGTYTRTGDAITFANVEPATAQGEPFPASITIDPASKAPAERAADGSLCVYTR
ncbi:MAG: hypothetical protein IT372_16100 [Polyangiaceae bacterium]|nr:hypothetical protein [Polyangiaceae bacterium]